MIEKDEAEKALQNLYKTQKYVRPITLQARLKAHMLKHTEGLLVKSQHNQGIPVSVAKEYAISTSKLSRKKRRLLRSYIALMKAETLTRSQLASIKAW
jgi:hypothetical protein